MIAKKGLIIFSLLLILTASLLIKVESLTIRDHDSNLLWQENIRPDLTFTLIHTHSVQRTPVKENFKIIEDEIVLLSTEYKSYGAGLPFALNEDYRLLDDYFVIDKLNQSFTELELRTGKTADHRLSVDEKEYRLAELAPLQSLLIIRIEEISLVRLFLWEGIRWLKI